MDKLLKEFLIAENQKVLLSMIEIIKESNDEETNLMRKMLSEDNEEFKKDLWTFVCHFSSLTTSMAFQKSEILETTKKSLTLSLEKRPYFSLIAKKYFEDLSFRDINEKLNEKKSLELKKEFDTFFS